MKFSGILLAGVLGLSMAGAAAADGGVRAPGQFNEHEQIVAELRVAPRDLVAGLLSDERKLTDFVAGRLQDMALADYARQRGLDTDPAIIGRRLVEERHDLVKAAVARFQEDERAKLPDLEQLARQRYLATRQQYALPEQIRVAHILLRADVEVSSEEEIQQKKARALELQGRLQAGEDFAALAREFSEEPATAERGGELPRLAKKGSFVPPFERAAWELAEGQVSGVVRTRFGFHLIKLLERKPASYRPFEEVRQEVLRAVQDEILAPKRSAFVDSFRGPSLDAKAQAILPGVREAIVELQAGDKAEMSEEQAKQAD
ncbi:MAG: peptidyl-prolyl cis-trans isomerase [Thauera propionica]|nr:peptidyl-prolyl cis-trans isomerase [Thauera propionica]